MKNSIAICAAFFVVACSSTALKPDAAIACTWCERWNQPHAPVQLAESTWYVGVHGLSSILIRTGDGLILLDGGLPQSAPLIADNIAALGFALDDIELIGLSHAHYDHAGGIAALQRASGARVVARQAQADALRNGGPMPDDPQFGEAAGSFPAVADVDVIADGWSIQMGAIRLEAVATPGHTPGGTSWLWTDCIDDDCLSIVYADSLSPISVDGFRFSGGAGDALRQSAMRIANFECDLFLAPHPARFGLHDDGSDSKDYSCKRYAEQSIARLDKRLAEERQPQK